MINYQLSMRTNSFSGCTNDIVSSDHSPVFASFDVPITSQFVATPGEYFIQLTLLSIILYRYYPLQKFHMISHV
jgi:hypothetical protein